MNTNRNREILKKRGAQMQPVEKRARVGPFTAQAALQALWHGTYEYSNKSIKLRQKFTIAQDGET